MGEPEFLGRPYSFWIEVKERIDLAGTGDLIQEIAELRAKVSFYESRINAMNKFMEHNLEVKRG